MFPKPNVKKSLDGMLISSLYTDQGKDPERFSKMRTEMTGSSGVPQYVVIDPVSQRVLGRFDATHTVNQDGFAKGLARALGRYKRLSARRGSAATGVAAR